MDPDTIVATLTTDKIIFKAPPKIENQYRYGNYIGNISSFFSLNLLHNCWVKWSYGKTIIHTAKFEFCPFNKMEFNWHGELISPIPKYAQKTYDKWHKAKRTLINAQSRARYAQNKAEREFKSYEKNGKIDEYPVENVFKLRNAQLRQIAIEKIGLAKILAPYETKLVHNDVVDGREYELIDIKLPGIARTGFNSRFTPEKWCLYLKMINPTTGEIHLEGVARKTDNSWDYIPEETVAGALAWRDGEEPSNRGFNRNDQPSEQWAYQKPIVIT